MILTTPTRTRLARTALGVLILAAVCATVALTIALAVQPSGTWVRYVRTVSVPARFKPTRNFLDYMTVGGTALYAAYMSHGVVAVVDLAAGMATATIRVGRDVHGVAIDYEDGLGFASNGSDGNVAVFDLKSHRVLRNIAVQGENPDAILYDQRVRLVYVASQKSASGTLIDPRTQTVVATIPLGGDGPEFCRADPETGLIYQNLQDSNEVVVVDPSRRAVVARFRLPPGQSPTGLALDPANHRLFVTGMGRTLLILDSGSGAILATLPIGALSDGVDYDPGLRRAYTANGVGTMTVVQQDDPDHYRVLESLKTRLGGHAVSVDPATHRIYVATFGSILVYDASPEASRRSDGTHH